jgi:hypothetical protein
VFNFWNFYFFVIGSVSQSLGEEHTVHMYAVVRPYRPHIELQLSVYALSERQAFVMDALVFLVIEPRCTALEREKRELREIRSNNPVHLRHVGALRS